MPPLRSEGAARLRFRCCVGCTFVFKSGLQGDHTTRAARLQENPESWPGTIYPHFLWPSFRVLSFTRRCPLPPRHRVTAPASPGNNEGLTVEVPRAFKLPRYGVLGTRHGSTCELAQTDNGVSRRPWNWKLCIRPDKRPLRIPTECILRPKRHWASLPASGPMAFWIEGRMATMAVMAPTSLRIRRSSRCWANKRRYNGMQPSGRTTTALDQHQDNLGKRCLPAELVNGFRDAFPETRRCPRHGWYGHR